MYASTTVAESTLIKTGATGLAAVIISAAADAATVTVYDNTAGSGTVLAVLKAAINTTVSFCPCGPLAAARGLYATVTGTGPSVTLVYG